MKHTMVLISNQEDCEHLGLQGPLKRLIAWKCVRYSVQSCVSKTYIQPWKFIRACFITAEMDLLTVVHACYSGMTCSIKSF